VGDYFKLADHTGAAADRLPFPASQASGLCCAFDGIRNGFLHPLDGTKLPFHAEFKSAEQGIEGEESVQPLLTTESLASLPDESLRWRARFFAHWRLWPQHAVEKDYRLALLPADTRIPDHSIWTHMQVVSALDGCLGNDNVWQPSFLKFQLGSVQDFISAARSIRDLWSGSYLLSWLMAAGLKALSAKIGPDAVIYPNLRGQPLFDLHWREELWSKVKIGDRSVWNSDSLCRQKPDLLTPNLPNVFLAIVPADRAAELGGTVKKAIEDEWKRIAGAVWSACEEAGLTDDEGGITAPKRKARFDAQTARFLSLSWHATPWPNSLEDALKLADGFDPKMPIQKARERVKAVEDMAIKQMPKEHRDWRYYVGGKDGPKDQLNNIGLGWSVILAFNSWALDAIRQTRHFDAANAGGWQTGTFQNKDVLTGRDEAVAGGRVWRERAENYAQRHGGPWKSLFKYDDWLGSATLVKRLWHFAYLAQKPWNLEINSNKFPMPNTCSLAAHDPFGRDDDAKNEAAETDSSEKYFAVLALDGDQIGKWVSGETAPKFGSQLADYSDSSHVQRVGAKHYFESSKLKDFLNAQRPLSPSYHLQFSEALNNFALRCARSIVEAFDGRLIYAGGDDVLALLPADTALACAEALRLAFTGREVKAPDRKALFLSPQPGFLSSDGWKDDHGRGRPIPFLVPGPAADCFVGIAIAHFKAPLQDVVRAAQAAERRAKRQLDRGALAVTLFKHSGETIEWGCKWDLGGLDLYCVIAGAMETNQLSSKFPYRVIELLVPYLTQPTELAKTLPTPGFDAVADTIIWREFEVACDRQRGPNWTKDMTDRLLRLLANYVGKLSATEKKLSGVIGLCQTVAFAHRTRDNDSESSTSAVVRPAEKQTQP